MTVGNRIKQRRIDLGMTQEELAIKMGYNGKSSISAAENCGDNITTTKVRRFADALGVSFRYLMGYEDNLPEDTEEAKDIRNAYLNNMYKLSSDEVELVEAYRLLDKNGKEYALNSILANVKKGQGSQLSKAANDK